MINQSTINQSTINLYIKLTIDNVNYALFNIEHNSIVHKIKYKQAHVNNCYVLYSKCSYFWRYLQSHNLNQNMELFNRTHTGVGDTDHYSRILALNDVTRMVAYDHIGMLEMGVDYHYHLVHKERPHIVYNSTHVSIFNKLLFRDKHEDYCFVRCTDDSLDFNNSFFISSDNVTLKIK